MQKEKTKKYIILLITCVMIVLIGITYAYFKTQVDNGKDADINVLTYTTDSLKFEVGNQLVINANYDNFTENDKNLTSSTYAKATLKANNKTNSATSKYNVFLVIGKNNFEYTKDENTPELLLQVTNQDGEEITQIEGLNYVSITDENNEKLSGFDITTKTGYLPFYVNRTIETTSTKTEQLNISIVFINYKFDQSNNAGSSFSARLHIQRDEYNENQKPLAEYIQSLYTGTQEENSIVYHDGSIKDTDGNILDTEDNSYRYVGDDFSLTEKALNAGIKQLYYQYGLEETEYLIFAKKDTIYYDLGDKYLDEDAMFYLSYDSDKNFSTFKEALETAKTDGYLRDDGVKNYVCFGSTEKNCPNNNLYRIIGVFNNKVKLIKAIPATNADLGKDGTYGSEHENSNKWYYGPETNKLNYYFWTKGEINMWSKSELGLINLDTNFYNSFKEEWKDMIANSSWHIADDYYPGNDFYPDSLKDFYNKEQTKNTNVRNNKISMLYVSEFLFSKKTEDWNGDGYKKMSWLANGQSYLTLTLAAGYYSVPFGVGPVGNLEIETNSADVVRPVFFLSEAATFSSGTGTYTDPIRLVI